VGAVLFRASSRELPSQEAALLRAGTVGDQLPLLQEQKVSISHGDMLVLATDGIDRRFPESLSLARAPEQVASRILARHWKGADDGLVLVARYRNPQVELAA
jgi:phosphoserine phosphatase RsbX